MAVKPFLESVTFCQQEAATSPSLAQVGVLASVSGQQLLRFVEPDVHDLGDVELLVDLAEQDDAMAAPHIVVQGDEIGGKEAGGLEHQAYHEHYGLWPRRP